MMNPERPRVSMWSGLFQAMVLLAVGVASVAAADLGPLSPTATSWYVSITGSDSTGSGSQANPFRTIPKAQNAAVAYDTIVVMPGTYNNQQVYIDYTKPVHLTGSGGASATVLDGGKGGTVVSFLGTSPYSQPLLIKGLTLRQGSPHGIRVNSWNVDIVECIVEGCETIVSDSNGAGISFFSSRGSVKNCDIRNNIANGRGGGIYGYNSGPSIVDCRITDNISTRGYGGGISFEDYGYEGDYPYIANNILLRNRAQFFTYGFGGAILLETGETVVNNLFAENEAAYGSAIYALSSSFGNVLNNIFFNNLPSESEDVSCGESSTSFGSSCFYPDVSEETAMSGCFNLGSNVFGDPRFVNYAGGDFHLLETSPCLNTGILSVSLPPTDFDEQKRVIEQLVDIGPDEFADCSMTAALTANPTSGCEHMLVTFNGFVEGHYDSLLWDFGDGTFAYNNLYVQKPYNKVGKYTVTLYAITPCVTVVTYRDDLITIAGTPNADFVADVVSGCAPLTVKFSDLSAGGITSRTWNFGDGSPVSADSAPVHVFAQGGLYNVKLKVSNICASDSLIRSQYINVAPNAESDFGATIQAGSAPLTVQFTDQSRNNPTQWQWDFGDGTASLLRNPLKQYTKPGVFDVWLASINACDIPDTLLQEDFVRVYGFDLQLTDSLPGRFSKTFDFRIDTLIGPYGNVIDIRPVTQVHPSRGSIAYVLEDSSMKAGQSSSIRIDLSRDVPGKSYRTALIGIAPGGVPADTVILSYEALPETLITTSVEIVEFDSTQVDSTAELSLRITNRSSFFDEMGLRIQDIRVEPSGIFGIVPPTNFEIPPGPSFRDVAVTFTPSEIGVYSGTLTIVSDDPSLPEYSIQLSGIGISERVLPFVRVSDPDPGEQDVLIDSRISFVLSEPIDTFVLSPAQLMSVRSSRLGGGVQGQVRYLSSGPSQWILRFEADSTLPPLDGITATLSGATSDLAGNTLDGNRNGKAEGSPVDDLVLQFQTGPGVHPGDANNDGVVNEADVLPIGVFWGITGPTRAGGQSWKIFPAESWSEFPATYADCNGDGAVNEQDVSIIGVNWGETHSWGETGFLQQSYDLREYRDAFERIYIAVGDDPANESARLIRSLIEKYIEVEAVPSQHSLSQNYPNPFNPTTYIQYTLPVDGQVTLTVHNILGQTVAVLVDRHETAGYKRVSWNGRSDAGDELPTGIYFYRLISGSFSQVKKMMLLR